MGPLEAVDVLSIRTAASRTALRRRRCMEIWPGKSYPLGATYDGTGVNFALFSEVAQKV